MELVEAGPSLNSSACSTPALLNYSVANNYSIMMEGYCTVVTGAHLFERRGSPRDEAGRAFTAFFVVERAALSYWPTHHIAAERRAEDGGAVPTSRISGVRLVPVRHSDAPHALQFELRVPEGRQRLVRMLPENPADSESWAAALLGVTGRPQSESSIAAALSPRADGWRDATVERDGLLWTPNSSCRLGLDPPWLAVRVRLERRGASGEPQSNACCL